MMAPTITEAADAIIAQMQASDAEWQKLASADKAREVTVTVPMTLVEGIYAGEALTFTVTGIAPFWPAETVGPMSGSRRWTVLGQEYASLSGLRSTTYRVIGPDGWPLVGVPSLSHREAVRLAEAIGAALVEASPAIINTKAA